MSKAVRTFGIKALSESLASERGVSARSLRNKLYLWAAHEGLPCTRTPSGPLFDLDEARAWLLEHKPPRRREPVAQTTAAPSSPRAVSSDEEQLLEKFKDPAASPLVKSRAAFDLSCIRLAHAHVDADPAAGALAAVERHSKELRQAQEAFTEQQLRAGELIEREDAIAVIGELAQRLIGLFERMQNDVALQYEIWRADPAFEALGAEGRARAVRAWIEGKGVELRAADSAAIDAMLDAEAAGPS